MPLRRSLMMTRLLASPVYLAMATALLAAPAFAQAPAAPAQPAPAAAAPAAPAQSTEPAAPAHMGGSHAMNRMQRIEKLQTALNANGATLTVDGKMGPQTSAALTAF